MVTRDRIVEAAARLLDEGGREAVTTRAVAAAAQVQAPTIYRQFGDKDGLLDAVAEHGFASYLAGKEVREAGKDPVEDLRAGFDLHVEFGLTHPALYTLMFGDPKPSAAAAASFAILREHVHRIAVAGRLKVPEELAAQLIHATGTGTVLALLADPHPDLAPTAREAAIAAITTDAPASSAAVTLKSQLAQSEAFSDGERRLLVEWLDRLA